MNRERMRQVGEAILQRSLTSKDFGFNMNYFHATESMDEDRSGQRCGTVGCIAGHTVAIFDGLDTLQNLAQEDIRYPVYGKIAKRAAELLELSEPQAHALFFAEESEAEDLDSITPEQAAAVCLRASETGEINWTV